MVGLVFCYVKHSKNLNVPFPRPFGQAEMMHENFMRMALPVFVVCCLRMKFYAANAALVKESRESFIWLCR